MTEIEDRYVDKAMRLVLERFPEMVGAEPSVRKKGSRPAHRKGLEREATPEADVTPATSVSGLRRDRPSPGPRPNASLPHYVLIFEKDVSLPGGHRMKRVVRVTMDESGEVVKLTSSK